MAKLRFPSTISVRAFIERGVLMVTVDRVPLFFDVSAFRSTSRELNELQKADVPASILEEFDDSFIEVDIKARF